MKSRTHDTRKTCQSMRITEKFELGLTQVEIDFVDVDTTEDTELFLDIELISFTQNEWSRRATNVVGSFFERFFQLLSTGQEVEARQMFQHLHEPNETCLGFSQGAPRGRGLGDGQRATELFESLRESKAATSGVVNDLEDAELFIPSVGHDTVSDMVTSLLRALLIEYTQSQCRLHGIELRSNTPSGFSWDDEAQRWGTRRTEMLVIDNEPRLLVPKWAVSRPWRRLTDVFVSKYALEFEKQRQLSIQSTLVQYRADGTPYVTKKSLREEGLVPEHKEGIARWAQEHPQVYEAFKNRTSRRTTPESTEELAGSELDVSEVARNLVEQLADVEPGRAAANDYHRLIAAALHLLFYPDLFNMVVENEVNEGRKRIDLTLDNRGSGEVFQWIQNQLDVHCPIVMVECKNYSSDPANPEVDQLQGRFAVHRGRLGFLCFREAGDRERLIQRCRDVYVAGNGLCLPVSDVEVVEMLRARERRQDDPYAEVIRGLVHEVALS